MYRTEYFHVECLFEDDRGANFTVRAQGIFVLSQNLRMVCSFCHQRIRQGDEYWAVPDD